MSPQLLLLLQVPGSPGWAAEGLQGPPLLDHAREGVQGEESGLFSFTAGGYYLPLSFFMSWHWNVASFVVQYTRNLCNEGTSPPPTSPPKKKNLFGKVEENSNFNYRTFVGNTVRIRIEKKTGSGSAKNECGSTALARKFYMLSCANIHMSQDDPDKLVSSVCKYDSATGKLNYCGTICLQVAFSVAPDIRFLVSGPSLQPETGYRYKTKKSYYERIFNRFFVTLVRFSPNYGNANMSFFL